MIRETIEITELSSRLTELLELLARGREVMVVQDQTPVARLIPPEPSMLERVPGLHRGDIWASDDFDDPLPDSFWLGEE